MNPSYTQLAQMISKILPRASFGEDMDGQLLIYTDMCQTSMDDDSPLNDFQAEE